MPKVDNRINSALAQVKRYVRRKADTQENGNKRIWFASISGATTLPPTGLRAVRSVWISAVAEMTTARRENYALTALGAIFATASIIAPMCAGVVPQQPPTIFTKPLCANSLMKPEVIAGVSS